MSVTVQPIPLLPAAEVDAAIPTEPIYRLSVAQYHAMADHGILDENDPVELLEGWLVQKMTKRPPHILVTLLVRQALERLFDEGWYVNSQEPITTPESEPEPDVFVVRGSPRNFQSRHPLAEETILIVEVADSTLRIDQGTKKRLYARAGIPIYWIANLPDGRFEVYTDPNGSASAPDYRQRWDYGPDDEIPVMSDGQEIGRLRVRDLLP